MSLSPLEYIRHILDEIDFIRSQAPGSGLRVFQPVGGSLDKARRAPQPASQPFGPDRARPTRPWRRRVTARLIADVGKTPCSLRQETRHESFRTAPPYPGERASL